MRTDLQKELESQIESLIIEFNVAFDRSKYEEFSDQTETNLHRLITLSRATVIRISGAESAYAMQVKDILASQIHYSAKAVRLRGVVEALLSDIKAGYIQNVVELIHGEVFGDFLEMAQYLMDEGYKDASAVVAGSTLESHLRQLCQKNMIAAEYQSSSGIRFKKADQMNSDLTAAGVYSKLDQKNVTAWLDLRNKAAHGQYSEYQKEQVSLLIAGIRDFMTRNTA